MELNIQKQGYDQNEDIKRMTYAKPWHMSCIPRGSLVGQKGGRSEGPGQSGPIQTVPESLVRCHRGISAWDRNRPNPIATTVNVSYLHNHPLSQAQIWWRSWLVSWLRVAVLGLVCLETTHSCFGTCETIGVRDEHFITKQF